MKSLLNDYCHKNLSSKMQQEVPQSGVLKYEWWILCKLTTLHQVKIGKYKCCKITVTIVATGTI